jgi:hypothetical protein
MASRLGFGQLALVDVHPTQHGKRTGPTSGLARSGLLRNGPMRQIHGEIEVRPRQGAPRRQLEHRGALSPVGGDIQCLLQKRDGLLM